MRQELVENTPHILHELSPFIIAGTLAVACLPSMEIPCGIAGAAAGLANVSGILLDHAFGGCFDVSKKVAESLFVDVAGFIGGAIVGKALKAGDSALGLTSGQLDILHAVLDLPGTILDFVHEAKDALKEAER